MPSGGAPGKSGRRRIPTALRIVTDDDAYEPEPVGKCLKPPHLTKRASLIWDRYAPELERLGLLTSIDASMFASFCLLNAKMEENPLDFKAYDVAQLRALATEFGMTPSARARMRMERPKVEEDANKRGEDTYRELAFKARSSH